MSRYGVVIPDQVSVRSGFSQGATELFVLHAGTTGFASSRSVTRGTGFRFSDQKIGWVRRNGLEPVSMRLKAEG